jgi:hypothetical protein
VVGSGAIDPGRGGDYSSENGLGDEMPLSEHEQKIITELEESLYKQDPRFARSVVKINFYALARRRTWWGVAGFIVGLMITLAFFTQSILLGLVGVGVMGFSALLLERNARLMVGASRSLKHHVHE